MDTEGLTPLARLVAHFYQALIAEGLDASFAEELTRVVLLSLLDGMKNALEEHLARQKDFGA